ncbi:Fis family transcriptional regulator, partial [Cyanothece sp. BG0011]|uniref:restriction endonuclease-related protein n=1 Tax=Cyanothece sp. BG0011 TaxID=2082950 RepID=UPI000D1D6B0A
TRHRDRILEALREWFRTHEEGPTLEELCVELRMQPKQKATLQRWLQTMRKIDIDWDDNVARSIRFLREETPEPEVNISVTDTLQYLASGLKQWETKNLDQKVPIPDGLRIGMSQMYLQSLLNGDETAPKNLPEFFEFSQEPFINWETAKKLKHLSPDVSLVEAGNLSNFAEQWVIEGGNITLEVQEKKLEEVLSFCRQTQLDETYREFRELIITQPVLSHTDYHRLIRNEKLRPLKDYFNDIYIDLNQLKADDEYHFCPRCGYVQNRRSDGTYHCRYQDCQRLVTQLKLPSKPTISREKVGRYKIVTPGIYRYGTIPGLWEIELKDELSKLGLNVTLWPEIDEFDLLVEFPEKIKWAIDVKDWSILNEERLKKVDYQRKCQKTLIVFPDIREEVLKIKNCRAEIEPKLDRVKLKLMREVIKEAKQILGE